MKAMKSLFTLFAALVFSTTTIAATPSAGVNYKDIVPAQALLTEVESGKTEVVEIFSYGCSHCHRFEPVIERWLKSKPDNIVFVRMPAVFNARMEPWARAYYAAEALGVLDEFHKPMFDAIHMEKRRLDTDDDIIQLAEDLELDGDKFRKALRSPYVKSKVKRAAELSQRYGVEATPSLVINGKYRTNPGMGRVGFDGMLKVAEDLASK